MSKPSKKAGLRRREEAAPVAAPEPVWEHEAVFQARAACALRRSSSAECRCAAQDASVSANAWLSGIVRRLLDEAADGEPTPDAHAFEHLRVLTERLQRRALPAARFARRATSEPAAPAPRSLREELVRREQGEAQRATELEALAAEEEEVHLVRVTSYPLLSPTFA